MAFDINSIVSDLEKGALDAAREAALASLKEAAASATSFVEAALPALNRYTALLMANQISKDEFEDLVLGLRNIAELNGLTQAGLTAIQIDNTKNTILKAISSVVIGAVSKAL